jgi:hypothetical protein
VSTQMVRQLLLRRSDFQAPIRNEYFLKHKFEKFAPSQSYEGANLFDSFNGQKHIHDGVNVSINTCRD